MTAVVMAVGGMPMFGLVVMRPVMRVSMRQSGVMTMKVAAKRLIGEHLAIHGAQISPA